MVRGRSEGNRFFRREFRALWRTRAYSRDRFYTAGEALAKVSPTTRRKKHPFFARATTFHPLRYPRTRGIRRRATSRPRACRRRSFGRQLFQLPCARISRPDFRALSLSLFLSYSVSLSLSISSSRSSRRNDLIEYDGNILRRCDNAGD